MNTNRSSEYVVHGSIGMTRGSLLRIDDGRDILVYVWEGEVWLTQYGDRQDRMLKRGDWFRIDRNGAAIAWSFKRSALTLTGPEPECYAERIQLFRPGSAEPLVLYSARGSRLSALDWFLSRLRRASATMFVPASRPTTAAL